MGWREKLVKFILPDYGLTSNAPVVTAEPMQDVAVQPPTTRDMLAHGLAQWPEEVYELDPDAYALIRRTPPILTAVNKSADAICKLDWTVRGGNAQRAQAFKDLWERSMGWPDYFAWQQWAKVEGWRAYQQKPLHDPDKTEKTKLNPTDWRMGGRRKWRAGPHNGVGTLAWDGVRLMRVESVNNGIPSYGATPEDREAAELDKAQFVIFRPGGGSSPEGEHDIGLACYDTATAWRDAMKNAKRYVEIYGVPMRAYEKRMSKTRPTNVATSMRTGVDALNAMEGGNPASLPEGDMIRLFQPQGSALTDLWNHMDQLAAVVWTLFLAQSLTQTTMDSGPTGSSTVSLSEKQIAILADAQRHAEALNAQWVPWAAELNAEALPPLAEGEEECWVWPEYPSMTDAGNMDKPGEEDEDKPTDPRETTPQKNSENPLA